MVGCALSLALVPLVRWLARRYHVVDLPNDRKVHAAPIPRLGGVGVYAAFLLTLWVCRPVCLAMKQNNSGDWWTGFLLGSLVLVLLGAVDDCRPLKAWVKLLGQIAGALVFIAFGSQIESVTMPGGHELVFGLWSVPLTVLWIVAVTNAFNLIDGLDGLASGVGMITALTLAFMIWSPGGSEMALLCLALAGCLVGFLRYNFYPATIFLGDSGSLFIGFTLAVIAIETAHLGTTATSILIPLLAFGLPLAEVLLTVGRRLLRATHVVEATEAGTYRFLFARGRSVFEADREHVHHRLLRLGYRHHRAVLILYGVCALTAVATMALVTYRNWSNAVLLGVVGMAVAYAIRKLDYEELQMLRNGRLLTVMRAPLLSWVPFQMLIDLGCLGVAFALAAAASYGDLRAVQSFLLLLPLWALVKLLSLYFCQLYQVKWWYAGTQDLLLALRAIFVSCAAGYGVLFVGTGHPPPIALVALDFYLMTTLLLATRFSHRILQISASRYRKHKQPVLIYGSGAAGAQAVESLLNDPTGARVPIGFIDEDPANTRKQVCGCPVLGTAAALPRLLRQGLVKELILATPNLSVELLDSLRKECDLHCVRLSRFETELHELNGVLTLAGETSK